MQSFPVPEPLDGPSATDPWRTRWGRLAHGLGLAPSTPVAIALSGGADSVYLLHLLARAVARPKVLAIHVDHGLRGAESQADAEFCARLCAKVGVPFARRVVDLDPEASDLEARAREARYRALADEASAAGISVLLTGHHEDDAVETLLMRWMRGTELGGLAGLRREAVLGKGHGQDAGASGLRVLRPLAGMRREEVRSALKREGLEWREDSSNASERFTRNRVRHEVLPEIEAQCGSDGVENFFEFARAIESFEEELADRTAHIEWQPVAHEAARRSLSMPDLGGRVPREQLSDLSPPLLRRALGRLVGEGTGRRPSRDVLAKLSDDLEHGRTGRLEIHEGWSLQLKSDDLHLTPPAAMLSGGAATAVQPKPAKTVTRPVAAEAPAFAPEIAVEPSVELEPQAAPSATPTPTAPMVGGGLVLGIPGTVQLEDGRWISAELVEGSTDAPPSTSPTVIEIDGAGLHELRVRFARPGDRVRALGAPGYKPVRRFLGEQGIPREERGNVPLVVAGEEVVWVAGVRISESRKIGPRTTRRVRLSLGGARGGDLR